MAGSMSAQRTMDNTMLVRRQRLFVGTRLVRVIRARRGGHRNHTSDQFSAQRAVVSGSAACRRAPPMRNEVSTTIIVDGTTFRDVAVAMIIAAGLGHRALREIPAASWSTRTVGGVAALRALLILARMLVTFTRGIFKSAHLREPLHRR